MLTGGGVERGNNNETNAALIVDALLLCCFDAFLTAFLLSAFKLVSATSLFSYLTACFFFI